MSMLNNLSAFADRAIRAATPFSPRYSVALIDRRTGRPHTISGVPLVLMTAEPITASHELMRNRDPGLWDIFIERMDRKGAIQ